MRPSASSPPPRSPAALALVPLAHRRRWRRPIPATYREFDQFMDVFNRVKADYVDKVDDKKLIKGAIQGMLASLDPHSSYVDALDYRQSADPDRGQLRRPRPDRLDGGRRGQGRSRRRRTRPACRAGIKAGDYITHIDGKLIFGETLDEAIEQMRGKPGTKIALTLVRPGRDKPLDVAMMREVDRPEAR